LRVSNSKQDHEMIHDFSIENLDTVAKTLGATIKRVGSMVRLEVLSSSTSSKLAVEFYFNITVDDQSVNVVSVYANNTFFQLHNCNGFIQSDILNQVTFFGRSNDTISGLIIDKDANCNFYANVSNKLLQCDFTTLPTELMMCSLALSLTDSDTFDLEGFNFDE